MKILPIPPAFALTAALAAGLYLPAAAGGARALQDPAPPAPAPAAAPEAAKKDEAPKKPEKKDPLKPFSEVVDEAKREAGRFNFWQGKGGEVWLEIDPSILDRPFFLQITTATGLGGDSGGAVTGEPLYDAIFELKRVHNNVQLLVKQTRFRAPEAHPISRSIERSFGPSILALMKVDSQPHPESGAVLAAADDLFLGDLGAIGKALSTRLKSTFSVDRKKSYVSLIKSFPENAEVEVAYGLNTDKPVSNNTFADGRSAQVKLRYSFIELPKSSYRPRLADPRVGYFVTAFADLSDDDPVQPHKRYILRWDIRKQNADAPISPPAKPIVFWLDNAIPEQYRPAVRDGLLAWNAPFEKLGIRDAIVVKQLPDGDEMDPFDIRNNMVRWATSPGDAYAVALFRENPLTGEVINAGIRMDSSIVGVTRRSFRLEDELKNFNGLAPVPSPERAHLCDYGKQALREAALGYTALELAQGEVEPAQRRKFVEQYITEVTAHEMGHILGLRHNFKASTLYKLGELHDLEKTSKTGVTSSVMDYTPPNIAPPGVKQGDYFSTVVGPYDTWAIEYGYSEAAGASTPESELPHLRRIAARCGEKGLAYATDEDVADWGFATYASDPMACRWDLGDDPLAYARQRAVMVQQLWDRLEKREPESGRTYQDTLDKFRLLLGSYLNSFRVAGRFVGAVQTNRAMPGDRPGGTTPLQVVPADRQREALIYIRTRLFEPDAMQFKPALLARLAPDKDIDWARNSFREDQLFSPIERILGVQKGILAWLFTPGLLARLRDNESRVVNPTDTLTMAELFGSVTGSIFSELRVKGAPVRVASPLRRELQRECVKVLVNLYLKGDGAPADAQSLAYAHLRVLRDEMKGSLQQAAGMDIASRAHIEQQLDRVQRTLDARVNIDG